MTNRQISVHNFSCESDDGIGCRQSICRYESTHTQRQHALVSVGPRLMRWCAIQVPVELIADFDEIATSDRKLVMNTQRWSSRKSFGFVSSFFPFEMFDNQHSFCCANSRANSSKQKPGWPQHTDDMIRDDLSSAWATEGHIFQLDFFYSSQIFFLVGLGPCFRPYPPNFFLP